MVLEHYDHYVSVDNCHKLMNGLGFFTKIKFWLRTKFDNKIHIMYILRYLGV